MQRPSAPSDWALIAAMTMLAHPLAVLVGVAVIGAAPVFDAWGVLAPPIAWTVWGLLGRVTRHNLPPGRPVRPDEEPELAALVRQVAERLDFRSPLLVRVIPVPDAALVATRVSGTRAFVLGLGWPLLRCLTAAQLSAVVAHELAHHRYVRSRRESLLLAARQSLADSMDNRLHVPAALLRRVMSATQARSWEPEFAADAQAAGVVGTIAVHGALERTAAVDAVFDLLGEAWASALDDDGAYPEDLYPALGVALQDPHVLRRAVAIVAAADTLDPYSAASHPPLGQRLAAVPERPGDGPDDGQPVRLRGADAIDQWCVTELVSPVAHRRAARILDSPPERFDAPAEEARSALVGATGTESIPRAMTAAIDAVDAGTWPHLAYAVDPGIRTMPASVRAVVARGVVAGCLGRAVSATLLEAGWGRASRWLTSVVVAPDGDVVDVRDVVEAALDTGDTARVRALLEAATTGAAA